MGSIDIRGLCKRYSRQGSDAMAALDDVSLSLRPGEFLGIIGPSGCGKTTLLKIVAGLVEFDSGQIEVNGAPFRGPGPDRRMVFQDFALLPWRTVAGNVEFGLEIKRVPKEKRQRAVKEVLATTGLSEFERYYPHELSGGMQQRVGLARALAVDPETLLMDEPFGSLDAQTKRYMQNDLLSLVEGSGKSVLFVTHDMDEAVLLCDRIIIMSTRPGRIVDVVDTTALLPRPRAGRVDEIKGISAYAELVSEVWTKLARYSDMRAVASQGLPSQQQHA